MTGRLENKLKTENKILEYLADKPDYLNNYYYSLASNGDSASSWLYYLKEVEYFLESVFEYWEDVDLKKITRVDIEKYMIQKQIKYVNGQKNPTSFQYRKRCYNLLKRFFEYALDSNLIQSNPMLHVKRPVGQDEVKRYYLTKEDMQSILEAVHHPDKYDKMWQDRNELILLLFMSTGMRNTAMSEINIDDIDFNNSTLSIVDKRSKTHIYNLSNPLIIKIKEWIEHRCYLTNYGDTDALFVDQKGQRLSPSSIKRMVYKYTEKALGYQLSPHKLRAAFCTIMYDMTGDIEQVRRMVGHSKVETTQRYIVDDNQAKEKASQLTSSYLF